MGSLSIKADGHEVLANGDRPLIIGRDATADIRCMDTRVSRRHLLVRPDNQGWLVEDSASTNGTFKDGQRIQLLRIVGPTRLLLGDAATGMPIDFEPAPEVAVGPSRTGVLATPTTVLQSVAGGAEGMASLRVRAPGQEFTLSGSDAFTIGRDPGCSLSIDDMRISRLHAAIRRDPQGWLMEDVGSANGTFQDGERVQQVRIVGTVGVLLGDAVTGVSIELAPVSPALPAAPLEDRLATRGIGPAVRGQRDDTELGRVSIVHPLMRSMRIGRSADNDIVLNDLQVSRHHAELRGGPTQGWELVDLSSHNGTFVNGQRINGAPVTEGDVIALGRGLFRLSDGSLEQYVDTGDVSFAADGITERTPEGKVLLDGVSFVLDRCSFLAVVGTSGAGKSTLLNALAGFRPARQGTVLFGGRDLYAWYGEMRQRIGYVPQDDILHRQLTVRRALCFSAELRFPPDVPAADRERRVDEVMAELGLTERANLAISKLSGGQRKRTSIALELLTKPDLLFLDEPTSGLDPGYEKSLMNQLRQLADGGRTIIAITHSLQSLTLCDRVLFLAPGGKVAFFGPPDEALPFFGRDDFADVFSDLETQRGHDWQERFRQSPISERLVQRPLAQRQMPGPGSITAGPGPPPPRHRWGRQLSTLLRRYIAVIASDKVNRTLLLLQAPILAVIFLLALAPRGFDPSNPTALRDAQLAALFLVTGATFLGAANAIREIVKEFPIYQRERAVGLSISAYVVSKVVVLSAVTILQAVVLTVVAAARQEGPSHAAALPGPVTIELIVDVALSGLASMGLALLVSALVKGADKAITLLPLLLVPQLVLSNPQLQIDKRPVLSLLAPASSAQLGYSMVGSTVDLNKLAEMANVALPLGAEKTEVKSRYNHDAGTWLADAGWLVLLFALELAATGYALKRRDPSLLGSPVRRPGAVVRGV